MHPRSALNTCIVSVMMPGVALVAVADPPAEAPASGVASAATIRPVADSPIDAYRLELLEVAYAAGSAMPPNPHIKNRSRAQEEVVTACFQLDQPLLALKYVEGIGDWRRGAGYADFVFYAAEHGMGVDDRQYLEQAERIAASTDEDWPRDVVRVKIARAYALLGNKAAASTFESDVGDSEAGKVAAVLAMRLDDAAFDSQFEALKAVLVSGNFDRTLNALDACCELYGRFYGDSQRRDAVEKAIRPALERLPVMVRINTLSRMAEIAMAQNDNAKALELIDTAQYMVDHLKWEPEDQVPQMGRMARLRAQADDESGARQEATAAVALFDAHRERIVDIRRPDALQPIAEAYVVMGDSPAALALYKRCVKEGVVNPNSRPRADDLVSICCSLAKYKVEPDAELWSLIRQTREGLGQPW